MLGSQYNEIEDGEVFDTIEEALLTSCHICGTELQWDLVVNWNPKTELPEISGESFSCGVKFKITKTEEGYVTSIVN